MMIEDIILKPCVEVDKWEEDLLVNFVDARSIVDFGNWKIQPLA